MSSNENSIQACIANKVISFLQPKLAVYKLKFVHSTSEWNYDLDEPELKSNMCTVIGEVSSLTENEKLEDSEMNLTWRNRTNWNKYATSLLCESVIHSRLLSLIKKKMTGKNSSLNLGERSLYFISIEQLA